MILPGIALSQTDEHHPDAPTPTAPSASASPSIMPGGLPEQCTAMMPMMHQMMQMMQGGMMPGMPADRNGMSDASKAYMGAMRTMDGPMMKAAQIADPDIAFVRAMIPHHLGAIEMAQAVLKYGRDERVKEWANQIITAQEAEISEMQNWLKQHAQ
jgi:uncharacterized protein (DUF305 family)